MDEGLPAYTANPAPGSSRITGIPDMGPPKYSPPTQFMIGKQMTERPLVGIPELKGHLALLHAFYELKEKVESTTFADVGTEREPKPKTRRWGWFVALAVERFDTWCRNLEYNVDCWNEWSTVIPPLDVLMVWHAYMLNPKWYGEDEMRGTLRALRQLDQHLATALTTDMHAFLKSDPSRQRIEFWDRKSITPFDPIQGVEHLSFGVKEIKCPLCSHTLIVDYIDRYGQGKGYLQEWFTTPCLNYCGIQDVTKEKLAVRKFANDLAAPVSTPQGTIAGTRFQPEKFQDHWQVTARPQVLAAAGVSFPTTTPHAWEAAAISIVIFSGYSLEKLRSTLHPSRPPRSLGRIMSAYNDDKPYSLDLVGAVLRQASFVKKMYDLGWTKQGFFDGDDREIVLHHARARYHGFLDLLSAWPTINSFCVPTLDIDLVWHTHQLHPTKYMQDTTRYVKRFIDHDDKVEGLRLSSAFDNTCKLWKRRFGIPYTHCGCPHPGQKAEDLEDPFSIGRRISRMLSFSSSNPSAEGSSRLESQQPQRAFKNLLIPSTDRSDAMIATHPSDHNAVRFTSKGVIASDGFDFGKYRHERMSKRYDSLMKQRRKRVEKLEKRKKLLDQKIAKAGASGFTVGGVSRGPHSAELANSASASSRERDRNGTATYSPYDVVFLAPIPLYYGTIGGCVPHAYDGGAVYNPTTGCGNCGSGGNCGGGCGNGGMDNLTSGDGSTCAGTTGTASGCGGCGGGCGGCGG